MKIDGHAVKNMLYQYLALYLPYIMYLLIYSVLWQLYKKQNFLKTYKFSSSFRFFVNNIDYTSMVYY